MKIFILLFLWSTFLISQVVKQDKLIHFGAGALVSILSYGPIHKYTKSVPKALLYSTACAFLVGTMKEVYDLKYGKTGFDSEDLAATTFGGLIASSFITILIKDKDKRKQLEKIEKFKNEGQVLKSTPSDAAITGLGVISKE